MDFAYGKRLNEKCDPEEGRKKKDKRTKEGELI
jgi:hypothetical protein